MPVTEADVAITERLSSHRPFRAVLKQTVDDFIVNEITQQNTVLTLTTLPRTTRKRPRPAAPLPSNIPFSEIDPLFPSQHPPPSTLLAAAISEAKPSHSFPVLQDKRSRTRLHLWVREYLPSYIGDTLQTDDGQVVRIRLRSGTKPWKKRRRDGNANEHSNQHAQSDNTYDPREHHADHEQSFPRNCFVNFVLWKRNRDTTEALTMLAKALSRNVKHFAYAGTKDKRAITTQLVQVRGVQERDLARANSRLLQIDRNRASVLVGNVSPLPRTDKSSMLRLGDLKGNRFTLVLRDVEPNCDQSIQIATHSIRELGFINYFGLQRFGSGVSPTHVTGFAVLRGDFEEVCRRILLPLRIGDDDTKLHPARKRFVKALEQFGNKEITASELLSQLAPWQRIERTLVQSFANDEKNGMSAPDYRKAFGKLPRFLRMMYGHAVQSYLWNIMASERIKFNKPDASNNKHAIEGDLVAETVESEDDLSFKTKVRQVTKEEEEKKSVSVYRVLVPVLGSEVHLPSAPYVKRAQSIIEAEKIDFKEQAKSEYQVKGTYRRLLAVPQDFESRFVAYSDKHDIVVPSKVEALLATLKEKKPDSPQTHGAKDFGRENSNQENRVSGAEAKADQVEMETDTIDEGAVSPKKADADDVDCAAVLEEHEEGASKTGRMEVQEEGEAKGSNSADQEEEAKAIASNENKGNAGNAGNGVEAQEGFDVDVEPDMADVGKNDAPEQAAENGTRLTDNGKQNGEGDAKVEASEGNIRVEPIERTSPSRNDGDVQIENATKGKNCHPSEKTDQAIVAKESSTSEDAAIEIVISTEANGRHSEGFVNNAKPAKVEEAFKEEENIGGIVPAQKNDEEAVSEKAGDELKGKQKVLVEDASHDKTEDASGHEVVPHGRLPTIKGSGSQVLNPGDPSSSRTDGDESGMKSRKALVISFSLGCAEYATMLVRELTGYESSTAAQKALQGSV
eukprot:TRINITY_DN2276_c0_g4_i1.p2 TRINITY_DN2276_c0_g4~~TRINITY_DN2276_c0_g4_i1.p2  ORF type:complete len:963 (+),score=197.81 TRINITY_DN2276_c0_g4_i1:6092-8980(+)